MSAHDNLVRAMKGGRFTSAAPATLDDLKTIPGTIRAHRVALEAAHAEAARKITKLQREFDRGDIGAEKLVREKHAAWEGAEAVVQERTAKIRDLHERAVGGFDAGWNELGVLATMASRDGTYAAYLKALPTDARDAELQRLVHARDLERLALAALVLEDRRADILKAIPLPQLGEARTFAAAADREFGHASELRELILKNEPEPPRAARLHVIQQTAIRRYGATSVEEIDVATRPRTDASVADYTKSMGLLKQIETEIASDAARPPFAMDPDRTEPTTHSAPNGLNTMRAALSGEQK